MLACVETRAFLHFAHPELNLSFVFASVFAVSGVYQQEMRQLASYTVQKNAKLSMSHRFFRCVPMCIAFRIGCLRCFCRLSFCTCHLRLAFVFQLCAGGGGGMGGVMTSTRTGLVSSASFVASYVRRISHRFLRYFCRLSTLCTCQLRLASVFQLCAGVGGGWGGVMTSMRMRIVSSVSFVALFLKRCRLLCEALVAASCCFTFETSTMQKPQAFEAFQTKTSQRTPKIIKNKRRKAWCLRQFRRKATKKQDQQLSC